MSQTELMRESMNQTVTYRRMQKPLGGEQGSELSAAPKVFKGQYHVGRRVSTLHSVNPFTVRKRDHVVCLPVALVVVVSPPLILIQIVIGVGLGRCRETLYRRRDGTGMAREKRCGAAH